MLLRCFYVGNEFGFIALRNEGRPECYFFQSKEQARALLAAISEHPDHPALLDDLNQYSLPETLEAPPLKIEGRASETITRLLSPIAQFLQGQDESYQGVYDILRKRQMLFFVLNPRKEDIRNATSLIGFCDKEDNHSVLIVHSKQQAFDALQNNCSEIDIVRLAQAQQAIRNSYLPETSKTPPIKIGDAMAIYLNNGYMMLTVSGGCL